MGVERELHAEQEFVDMAYSRLDDMRAEATAMLEGVLDLGKGGTFQSRTERDVIVRTSMARLEQLDIGDQALTFGRIDRVVPDQPEADGNGTGIGEANGDGGVYGRPADGGPENPHTEVFHIGRLAIHTANLDPLVVDWRAPVAEPFYRATGRDPQGLVLRRHLALDSRKVIGVEDERFSPVGPGGVSPSLKAGSDADEPGRIRHGGPNDDPRKGGEVEGGELIVGDAPIGGPGALLSALDRVRTGRMADIVSTIQREQDEIIRSPLSGVMVVQGGPGTGKTAVALHRAAYLLYTHRFPLERQGVLVVGPNPLFLRYIEQVLPSLGETGVTLSTISGLAPDIRVRGSEPAEVALLKGDPRMAKVLRRAIGTRQRGLGTDAVIPYGALFLRLAVGDSRDIVQMARRRPGSHNSRRHAVSRALVQALAERARQTQLHLGAGTPTTVTAFPGYEDFSELDDEFDVEDFSRKLRRVPEFMATLDRIWPRLSPHELLHDLFGAPALVGAAGKGILSSEEQALLYRPRSASLEEVTWTAADAALADEARSLLGPRNGNTDDIAPNYGHIVVDEVQDLSPMQLRMVARRSLSGSMTVVGDLAQATAPWTPRDWSAITAHLPSRRPARVVELTVSYRTPAEVLEIASRVLAVAAPGLEAPRPVRRTGNLPRLIAVAGADGSAGPDDRADGPDTSDDAAAIRYFVEQVAEEAAAEVAAVSPGRVAVLAPADLLPSLATALADAGFPATDPRRMRKGALSEPLVLLAADAANGLEFDSVVVVEPGRIAGGTTRGRRTLYVALTRPTQRLTIIYRTPLPAEMRAGGGQTGPAGSAHGTTPTAP